MERRYSSRSRSGGTGSSNPSSTPAAEPASALSAAPGSDQPAAEFEEQSETGLVVGSSMGGSQAQSTVSRPRGTVRRSMGGMASRPRRSMNKPSPRPLPPPDRDEEDLVDPFQRRGLRRSPPPGVLPEIEHEEPELPPTPTQKGISDPASINTSPTGIHSSPSKRPRRNKTLAEKMTSSPLKQPPMVATDIEAGNAKTTLFKRGRGRPSLAQEVSVTPADEKELWEKKTRSGLRLAHPARKVKEEDPNAEQKAVRDSLLAEISQLQKDLSLARRESQRIQQDAPIADKSGLLDLLSRHILPPEEPPAPDPTEEWLQSALNPMTFLPFGGGATRALLPPMFAMNDQQEQKSGEEEREEEQKPTSHHPLAMSAEEELPFLQTFTPLSFHSTISMVPQGPSSSSSSADPLQQKHTISVSSNPPGLFAAQISMTVDTKRLSIPTLSVTKLDPAATSELEPFIRRLTSSTSQNQKKKKNNNKSNTSTSTSGLKNNITILTWSMAEWLRLATRRARLWTALEQQLLLETDGVGVGIARCVETMVMRRKTTSNNNKKRKRRLRDDGEDEEEYEDGRLEDIKLSRAELLAKLGKTSLDIEIPPPTSSAGGDEKTLVLRVNWRIEFDWSGEGVSKLGVLVEAPAKWHANDKKGRLANIPVMFDRLVKDNRDPLVAVKTAVALLAGGGGAEGGGR